jgi:uncharacterized membrane protein
MPFQVWLERALGSRTVAAFMTMEWSWPAVESLHFIGLTMLFGSIAAWDLRLMGVAKQVPLSAFHRLIPFAVAGFIINVSTGVLFLMTDADQYIYNWAFHLKLLWLALAGLNVIVFYILFLRRIPEIGAGMPAPLFARLSGAMSLALWTLVIIFGRLITFYRPFPCLTDPGFLATCLFPR